MFDSETITVFSTSWCGACRRLKTLMAADGIAFAEVDIEHDPEAEAFVIETNHGNAMVPTVLFPDGSTLTNPSLNQVRAHVAAR